MTLACPYCGSAARHRESSAHVYRGRDYGPIWECPVCDAYVGCHPDGRPLGRLADKALRVAKRRAHDAFDPLWKDWRTAYPGAKRDSGRIRGIMRSRAYRWLASQLGIPVNDCHIGEFDEAMCARVVDIIARERPTSAVIRQWAKQQHETRAA